eukprot:Mycagemm_TRINITY_DN10329_c7_g4::TRINITY_DN10329_c7_g4_i1::g.1323::m.1323 type:complete len:199 gc:universal TRINITY_DN10329_c7_g4_i1:197-793(+)
MAAAFMEGATQAIPGVSDVFNQPNTFLRYRGLIYHHYRQFLDASTPHIGARWAGTAVIGFLYVLRVYSLSGWHIVSYALGIYFLNLLIGFLAPAHDPEFDGGALPLKGDDEFRPFVRRLPEFKFWHATTRAFVIAIICTFFSFLNIPVFWPILLIYFLALFFVTMRKQIRHMIQFKYVPFTTGKKRYRGKVGDKKAEK